MFRHMPVRLRAHEAHGPTPPIRSTVMCVMYPGGGLSIGGNLTSGPMYVWASRWSSSGAPPSVIRPRVHADVADLAMLRKMPGHYLVAVEADPHDRYLRFTVGFDRHQVGESGGLEDSDGGFWE